MSRSVGGLGSVGAAHAGGRGASPQGPPAGVAAGEAGAHDAAGVDAGATGAAGDLVGVAFAAHLLFLVGGKAHLVPLGHAQDQFGVAVGQVGVGALRLAACLIQQGADAASGDLFLLALLAPSCHSRPRRSRLIKHEAVAAAMRRAANPWDRFYRYQQAPWRGERRVQELLPFLGGGPVLELGVGNGKTLGPLRAAGVDVVGLDVAFHPLRRLATGPRGRPGQAPDLVLADAAVLPFQDASFSAVLDLHCTGHLLEAGRHAAVAEVHRVLRPEGHVVVERLGPGDLRAGKGEVVEPGTRRLQDGRTTHLSDLGDLRREWLARSEAGTRGPPGAGGRFIEVGSESIVHRQRVRAGHARRETTRAVFQKVD